MLRSTGRISQQSAPGSDVRAFWVFFDSFLMRSKSFAMAVILILHIKLPQNVDTLSPRCTILALVQSDVLLRSDRSPPSFQGSTEFATDFLRSPFLQFEAASHDLEILVRARITRSLNQCCRQDLPKLMNLTYEEL